MKKSRWVKCISSQGTTRGVAIEATDYVQKAIDLHGLVDEEAVRLGEALIGGMILASYAKFGERINLNVRGTGQIKQALVDGFPEGFARGYVVKNDISAAPEGYGPWGDGLLSVLRTKGTEGQPPYIGTVPMATGHLAKDLTFYWVQSEQVPSAVGIAVSVEGSKVIEAGGFLVQAMPGASEKELEQIEKHIVEVGDLARRFGADAEPTQLLSEFFQDSTFLLLEEKEIGYRCECSLEKVERALILIGKRELISLRDENKDVEVNCDFCRKLFTVSVTRLGELSEQTKRD